VAPTYAAVYQYHHPGTEVRPHLDGPGYDLAFQLTVVHEHPTSVLVADGHDPVALPPGHGVVLHGQQVRHGWTRLGDGEHRTLLAVGFRAAEGERP
jgi:hypothetical protein